MLAFDLSLTIVLANFFQVTYHSVVLLEWEHGDYCTVVEGGASTWFSCLRKK